MTDTRALTAADLDAESAVALPTKEVMSLLDLNADVDLGLDLAAPVDLAVAANLNVAAPIEAAAGANVLSVGSEATSVAQQQVLIDQGITGDAIADAPQDAVLDQSDAPAEEAPAEEAPAEEAPAGEVAIGDLAAGNLLDLDLNIAADADVAAPIAGAVAANANIAAPIDAAVSANIGSIDSEAVAVSEQTAIINQSLDGVTADATADQDATVTQ